ncbi:hypothetical protein EIN_052650 [Entamoeba invadens IP1]|uniref:hypothetical protein n=1 Tax=Entamoeba invadens IP1 TaxID=370355 RepID=UPI0002C3E455|nr:hypothetical protein EIN_052650 [Entamoeba invadens IP1]ELP93050.1 hypothetical protein EIN_052650 [Entamoeba invadens IP1]|eukprot:XP_004259821.1 hypothetical protein EIN_052650 [Entamoeba invadens IP1]
MAVKVSNTQQCATNDLTVYKCNWDPSFVLENEWVLADSGYRGVGQTLIPYPKTGKNEQIVLTEDYLINMSLMMNGSEHRLRIGGNFEGTLKNSVFKGGVSGSVVEIVHFDTETVQEIELYTLFRQVDVTERDAKCRVCCTTTFETNFEDVSNSTYQILGMLEVSNVEFIIDSNHFECERGTIECESMMLLTKVDNSLIKAYNAVHSSVRILVENHFGRLIILFKLMRNKYGLLKRDYESLVNIAHSLCNYHISKKPLRKFPFYLFKRMADGDYSTPVGTTPIQLPRIAGEIVSKLSGEYHRAKLVHNENNLRQYNSINEFLGVGNSSRAIQQIVIPTEPHSSTTNELVDDATSLLRPFPCGEVGEIIFSESLMNEINDEIDF